jgi:hypothetical protein
VIPGGSRRLVPTLTSRETISSPALKSPGPVVGPAVEFLTGQANRHLVRLPSPL